MKYLFLILYFFFGFSLFGQNIIINATPVNVSQNVSFPFWLDSMATIEIGSHVVSISALEFNIVPTANGNSLVFSQTKVITTEETVPNGVTWKLEGVLLDSTASIISSGQLLGESSEQAIIMIGPMYRLDEFPNFEHALKSNSSNYEGSTIYGIGNAMFFSCAIRFCSQLIYQGYDDWFVPSRLQIVNYFKNNDVLLIPNVANLPYSGTQTQRFFTTDDINTVTSAEMTYVPNYGSVSLGTTNSKCLCVR